MTDGAARTLLGSGNRDLIERAVSHLTSRDPKEFWTSGQWMTELTGGSDVGASETIAKPAPDSTRNSELETRHWLLYGRKWFTSAATSQIALTLARPEGNPAGGRGLALFYLEMRDEHGRLRNISIDRLKDKLGTRKVPTAELTLNGTPAQLVMGTTDGVRNIAPLLNITRLWNGISAVSLMRRSIALALDYAHKRSAFGSLLSEKPLHMDTLAGLQAEAEASFHFAFLVAELTGRAETGELDQEQTLLLRLLTPLMKLTTGKQVVAVVSEALEAFGGAGYVEDTGLPMLLRDAQVLPIWEGTTNVLALDAVRALGADDQGFAALKALGTQCISSVQDQRLAVPAKIAHAALAHSESWLAEARKAGTPALEAGARRFALTLGRATELALLCTHAQWSQENEGDTQSTEAARRFSASGIDLL